jgi:hypothetical protein
MEACMFRSYPLYQPLTQSNHWEGHQGFFEYQIDSQTYLIGYSNYMPAHPLLTGTWRVRSMKKLMQGAQQYALYRAAEFTKAKGQPFFVVLYKDDWYATGYVPASGSGRYRTREHLRVSPGAWVMIRIVDTNTEALVQDDNRVYSADAVLVRLAQENHRLAANQGVEVSANSTGQYSYPIFDRWRSSSSAYDSVPSPGDVPEVTLSNQYIEFQTDSQVTQTAPGKFTITVWASDQISPIEMLLRSLTLARREGYEAFTLEKWTIEEHVGGNRQYGKKIWFRDTIQVGLQHQKGPSTLEPVFEVDELSSRMNTNGVLFPR